MREHGTAYTDDQLTNSTLEPTARHDKRNTSREKKKKTRKNTIKKNTSEYKKKNNESKCTSALRGDIEYACIYEVVKIFVAFIGIANTGRVSWIYSIPEIQRAISSFARNVPVSCISARFSARIIQTHTEIVYVYKCVWVCVSWYQFTSEYSLFLVCWTRCFSIYTMHSLNMPWKLCNEIFFSSFQ